MLEIEGKEFKKVVEKKEYRTEVFSNSCPLSNKWRSLVRVKKNGEKFFTQDLYLNEDEYVKNYANPLADINFTRQRVFIEESDDKISLKYQFYNSSRKVGNKFFLVRKVTRFLTFNYRTRLFYSGRYTSKKKKKIGSTMSTNPNYYVIGIMIDTIRSVDRNLHGEGYVYHFLETIWDKLGLVDSQNFTTMSPQAFYSLTFYLVNGVKLPNTWLQLSGTFIPKKEFRKNNFNMVDTFMSYYGLKGNKIKKIINECYDVDFNKLTTLYHGLGIDRFNRLDDKIFSESYVINNAIERLLPDISSGGRHWYVLREGGIKQINEEFSILTNKEKDRITSLNLHLQTETLETILEHIRFKKELKKLGENVKMKFNDINELNSEHEEWSRLIQSYKTGEVERYYGKIDSLESPIIYNEETYYPVLLRNTDDYEKESQHQRNCVRTYSQRADCMIFSIRKGSPDGEERVTVEYQFRKREILNVQERSRFNEIPPITFSEVAKIQLANINLLYKLGTLKLPKLIKKFRNGKVVEHQSVFDTDEIDYREGGMLIRMTPRWDNETIEINNYFPDFEEYRTPVNFLDDLP
jgi:hypothetical protein